METSLRARAILELRRRRAGRKEEYADRISWWRENPVDYFVDRLGIKRETIDWSILPEYREHKWDGTPNPLTAICSKLVGNKWVGVESATGTGKTYLGALLVFWFLECWENSFVVTTAPKQDQLELNIWKWVEYLHPRFGIGTLTSLRLNMIDKKDFWMATGFVAGVNADEKSTTRAQGFHAEHMLIILEETPGIPLPTINAFQNTCTSPHNLILAFGNPDHQLDNLHTFCTQEGVEHIRVSAYDHPNVVKNDPNYIPGAASTVGIDRIINKFGKDSPLALSRTRGISPAQSIDALIKVEWCLKAVKLHNQTVLKDGDKALGVDVANSEAGDLASIAMGIGNICVRIEDFRCPDSNQLGHMVYRMLKEENISPKRLGVDGVGVGAGTINTLREYGIRDKRINLQGGATPVKTGKEEKYNNFRTQMWWQCREDLRNGEIGMPNDTELIADLTAPKFETQNGKIVVESKEYIKKRLGRSPNKGDAFVYWNWVRIDRSARSVLRVTNSLM